MSTLYSTHNDFLYHDTGSGHPECPERLQHINKALSGPAFAGLIRVSPPLGTAAQIQLIHPHAHLENIQSAIPQQGLHYWDADTVLSSGSLQAALRAVGAVCDAVDRVLGKDANNAFCGVRPPGHHAEPDAAMGFCLFNNIAIAAEYARHQHQLERVAIVDFDVHHGNGTQAAFYQQPNVLYVSSHEMPNYPGTGHPRETGLGNIINVPLATGTNGVALRHQYQTLVLPALNAFKPELVLVSAGFDAHKLDPLSGINLVEDDYRWLTEALLAVADRHAQGRLVSVLEGGYHLQALAASVAVHVQALMAA